jgi:hypothetical protein
MHVKLKLTNKKGKRIEWKAMGATGEEEGEPQHEHEEAEEEEEEDEAL